MKCIVDDLTYMHSKSSMYLYTALNKAVLSPGQLLLFIKRCACTMTQVHQEGWFMEEKGLVQIKTSGYHGKLCYTLLCCFLPFSPDSLCAQSRAANGL